LGGAGGMALLTAPRSEAEARQDFGISTLPEDAFNVKAKPQMKQSPQEDQVHAALHKRWQTSAAGDADAGTKSTLTTRFVIIPSRASESLAKQFCKPCGVINYQGRRACTVSIM
jgi:hypothetical protein